jgi:hypothetical protein
MGPDTPSATFKTVPAARVVRFVIVEKKEARSTRTTPGVTVRRATKQQ